MQHFFLALPAFRSSTEAVWRDWLILAPGLMVLTGFQCLLDAMVVNIEWQPAGIGDYRRDTSGCVCEGVPEVSN